MNWNQYLQIAALIIFSGQFCQAVDLHVDPVNGNDANDGASWQTALKTITAAGQKAGQASDGVNIFLSEGTFCAETGEAFPIEIGNLLLLSGASSVSTIINAGDSAGILLIQGYPDENDYASVMLNNVSIQHDGSVPGANEAPAVDARDRPCAMALNDVRLRRLSAVSFQEDQGVFAGVYSMECHGCEFDDVTGSLASYQPVAPIQFLFDDCSFYVSPQMPMPIGGPELRLATWPYGWAIIDFTSCQFSTAGDTFALVLENDSISIENCLFENCRVETWGSYWYGYPEFRYCTFSRCELQMCPHGPVMWFSILDDGCVGYYYGEGEHNYCRVPPGYPRGEGYWVSSDAPLFVHGPLGPYYLSNEESGQGRTTPFRGWAWIKWVYDPSTGTTRTDGVLDGEQGKWEWDIGYHYPSVPPPPPSVTVRTDRSEYAVGEEMQVFMTYENRGVKVEGAIYFAFGPDRLDWLIFWPWMTFVPTPCVSGTLYSGVSYLNLPPTAHTIPGGLAPGHYLWLGAVLAADGTFASDIAVWPVRITGPVCNRHR